MMFIPGFKPMLILALLAGMAPALSAAEVGENRMPEEKEWKETEVPPPPAFDLAKLLTFPGLVSSPFVYGVDPASVNLSASDGLVRYVLVASVPGGTKNVMYEAIRCATGEFKTYARQFSEGVWRSSSDPQWETMFDAPSRHAFYFARAGACDLSAPPTSVRSMVNKIKNPNASIR
jgi:hypothetical protein